jgi:hypothetical protein
MRTVKTLVLAAGLIALPAGVVLVVVAPLAGIGRLGQQYCTLASVAMISLGAVSVVGTSREYRRRQQVASCPPPPPSATDRRAAFESRMKKAAPRLLFGMRIPFVIAGLLVLLCGAGVAGWIVLDAASQLEQANPPNTPPDWKMEAAKAEIDRQEQQRELNESRIRRDSPTVRPMIPQQPPGVVPRRIR